MRQRDSPMITTLLMAGKSLLPSRLRQCGHRMKPIKGRSVYCSYGSVPCPPGAERGWLLPIRCLRSTGISLMGVAHAPADVVVLRPASCVAGPVKAGFGNGALFRRGRD